MYNVSRLLLGYGVIIRKRGEMSTECDTPGNIGLVEADSHRGIAISYSLGNVVHRRFLSFGEIGKLLLLGELMIDDNQIIIVDKEPSSLGDEIEKASKRWTKQDVSFPHLAQIAKHFYNLGRNETYIKAEDWLKCNVGMDEDGEDNMSWEVLFSDEDEMFEDFKNYVIE